MIISYSKNFIFIKSRKTAGSSLQIMLSRYIDPQTDIVVGSCVTPDGEIDESNSAGINRSRAKHIEHPHSTADQIRAFVGEEFWARAYKFTIIRNPYDIAVSRYHWDLNKANRGEYATIQGFRWWLTGDYIGATGTSWQDVLHPYYSTKQGGDVIHKLKYEDGIFTDESMSGICEVLGVTTTEFLKDVPHAKKTSNRKHYSFYYDDEAQRWIAYAFAQDIAACNYSFEYYKPFTVSDDKVTLIDHDAGVHNNVNGPSMIKAPDWIDGNLRGKYLLYYAHHRGQYIRLAYSDYPMGLNFPLKNPLEYYTPGVLHLKDTDGLTHVASPDVHIDEENQQIVMYYHTDYDDGQWTNKAVSNDGINFETVETKIAHFYFRKFGRYGIAKKGNESGVIYEYIDGKWTEIFNLIPKMRHAYPLVEDGVLYLFYSVVGHAPEHIRVMVINMDNWEVVSDYELCRMMGKFKNLYLLAEEPSSFGAAFEPKNELRDPFVMKYNGDYILMHTYAGEYSIVARKMKKS